MDVIDFARYLAALAMVLGLLGAAYAAARKYGLPGVVAPQGLRRLAIAETLMLDARHKAFLVRRDGVEHLIVVGPNGASTIECGIAPPNAHLGGMEP